MIRIVFTQPGDVQVNPDIDNDSQQMGFRDPKGSPLFIKLDLENEKMGIPCKVWDDLNGPIVYNFEVDFDEALRQQALVFFETQVKPRLEAKYPELVDLQQLDLVLDPPEIT